MFGLTQNLHVLDTETSSDVDIRKAGAYRYFASPHTRVLMVGFEDQPSRDPHVWETRDAGSLLRVRLDQIVAEPPEQSMFCAFNAAFDHQALAKHGMPTPANKWLDLALLAYALCFTGRLDEVCKQFELPVAKNPDGSRLISKFSKARKPWYEHPDDWAKFVAYCADDVRTERALLDACAAVLDTPAFRPMVQSLQRDWLMGQEINERGLPVGMARLRGALRIKAQETARLVEVMKEKTGLDNPNSRDQLFAWANAHDGVNLPDLRAEHIRDQLDYLPPAVADVLRMRLDIGKASVTKFDAFAARQVDGRIKGAYITAGASRTGRTASRGANMSNIERPKLDNPPVAASILETGNADLVRLLYDEPVMTVLGSCVRATLQAPEGKLFCVYDLKSIESVGLAWLSGCQTILDIFFAGRDSYRHLGTLYYHKPYYEITKAERNFMKPPFLSFGFGSSGEPLVSYAANLGVDMDPSEADALIKLCRVTFHEIPRYWGDLEAAAKNAILNPGRTFATGPAGRTVYYNSDRTFLRCRIPSGRTIFYYKPEIRKKEPRPGWIVDAIHYWGRSQGDAGQWRQISTWGGMLAENCLAGDTLVVTPRGPVPIKHVRSDDRVWDGVEWVRHSGLINNGVQDTISVDGVRMTPDHLVLTSGGWYAASQLQGLARADVWAPNGYRVFRQRQRPARSNHKLWERVEVPVFLRERDRSARERGHTWKDKILRVFTSREGVCEAQNPRDVSPPRVRGMEIDAGSVPIAYAPSVAQLWGAGHNCLRGLAGVVRNLLEGHGKRLSARTNPRTDKQQRRVFPRELQVGYPLSPSEQQEKLPPRGHLVSPRADRDRAFNVGVQMASRAVYDIRNAGPRARFMVLGNAGPLIVHNCTQALCRDVMYHGLHLVNANPAIEIVGSTYDEAITLIDADDADAPTFIERCMTTRTPWMDDQFFLGCEGTVTKEYGK